MPGLSAIRRLQITILITVAVVAVTSHCCTHPYCRLLYIMASVIILVADLTPSPSPGDRTVVENTEMTLSCEVSYYGYKAPVLEWYNNQGILLPSTADDVGSTLT